MPNHRKKFKQYQVLAKITPNTSILVQIYADNTVITTQSLNYDPLQDSDAQKLKVQTSGRFRYTKTDLTIPVVDNVQLIGFGFIFKENTPK